jgi:hypothetical protein
MLNAQVLAVCTLCQAWASIQLYIDFKIYVCNHMLNVQVLAVCTLCQAWTSIQLYIDFRIYVCNHMLYAHVLAVCTLCQAWACELALASIIVTFCDLSMCTHGLVDGSWSLAKALMQASGCMELMFCYQKISGLQLAFPHSQEGLDHPLG